MHITHVSFARNGTPQRLQLRDIQPDNSKNVFTVINGENGTGKSSLLRIISDAALGLEASRQYKMFAGEISITMTGKVSRTIALSGTHNDRFPLNSGVEIRANSNRFDLLPFYYYGPKQSGNYTSSSKASTTIAHSLLLALASKNLPRLSLAGLLEYMGFLPWMSLSFEWGSRPRRDEPHRFSLLRKRIESFLEDVPSNSKLTDSLLETLNASEAFLNEFSRDIFPAKKETGAALAIDLRSGAITYDRYFPLLDIANRIPNVPQEQVYADLLSIGIFTAKVTLDRIGSRKHRLDDLSSGEWQLFYSLANLLVNVADDSLVLIDEPENSLHPRWQTEYLGLVRELIKHRSGCHVVIATHSPLVTSSLMPFDGNLVSMQRAGPDDEVRANLEDTAYGWSPSDTLKERFEMDSVRPPEITKAVNAALRLLKEDSLPRSELTAAARRIESLRKHLPSHDPLLAVMDAIVKIASGERRERRFD
ncbi:AAA family ATPase [Rhizobium ruizarguesonis]|nr:AAA family ATPase [Rhizobium ruizarguesonis]